MANSPPIQKMQSKFVNTLMGRRAFVTGASGFIGAHLCRRLLEEGVEVYAISRVSRKGNDERIHWFRCDLVDCSSTRQLIKRIKPDLIFNLAGYPVSAREVQHVRPSLFSNLVGAVSLLTAATEVGCSRVILAGSLEEPEIHDALGIASSPYAVSKWACSAYARMFHALYQLPVVNLRIFMVYGPGKCDPKRLIPYVISSLMAKQSPHLTSGNRLIDWIYVEDVVDALVLAATKEGISGKTIDVGMGKTVSVKQLVSQIVQLVDPKVRPSYGALPDRKHEQIRIANVWQSSKVMGWVPQTPLREGLRCTVKWYRENLYSLR